MAKIPLSLLFTFLFTVAYPTEAEQVVEGFTPDWLDISGFGRVVGGQVSFDDGDSATYLEYEDGKLSFDSQSLVGIQFDVTLSEVLHFSTQLLGHTAENRDSGVEWLYISYQPNDALTLKAGTLRIPLFNYSDVIDVGYAYTWITPPRQVYIDYLFSNYDGINAQYTVGLGDLTVTIEGYLGQFDDEIVVAGERANLEIDGLKGLVITAWHKNTKYRVAYHQGKIFPENQTITAFQSVLQDVGFLASANTLEASGDVFALQTGMSYQNLEYFVDSEIIYVNSDSITIPDVKSFYVTAGKYFGDISVYSTISRSRFSSPARLSNIPTGRFVELDILAQNYNQIFDTIVANHDELDSISVGMRWDYALNRALKIELSRLYGAQGQRSFFSVVPGMGNTNDAYLGQIAFEWVF